MKAATNSGWASSLFRGELEIPVAYLLTHQEELQIARRIRLSLARLRQLLPRHPLGYRRFLSRMEEVMSGRHAFYPWASLKENMSSELLSTREALRRAEALSRSDPSSSLAAFEAGVEILLKYPLHPETLYQWAREVARSTSPLGPLGGMEQIQKTLGILKRLLVTLEKARDRLVMPNYRLVLSAAFRFSAKGMDQTDLFQEGIIGLHKAVFRFDPDREFRFSTYATYWIRQSIRKALVDRSTLIRVPQAAQQKLYQDAGDLSIEEAERLLRLRSDPTFFSNFSSEDEDHVFDVRDRGSPEITEAFHTERIPEAVRSALSRLGEFEREIVEKRYGLDGKRRQTLEEIGSQVSLSRERIRQIESAAVERLSHYRALEETYEDLTLAEPSTIG